MGIGDRPTSPRSPWQNAYAERLIGTLRRDCLDHVLIFGAPRIYGEPGYVFSPTIMRPGRTLGKDAPVGRAVQRFGRIVATPILYGLHHRYAPI
jgi:hypothetical protein